MTASYRPGKQVGWVVIAEDPPSVAVAALPLGPPLVLEGSAGAIWLALGSAQTVDGILAALRDQGEDLPDDADGQVESFLETLVRAGVVTLSPVEESDPICPDG